MTHRSMSYFLSSYLSVLRDFRNGPSLIRAHHTRQSVERAVFWNGQVIENGTGRAGFVDTLVEMWGLQEYTRGGFYHPKDGDVIVDLGANIGLFSIWLARRAPAARILAFEPFAENCGALRRNLTGWDHRIAVQQLAVGRAAGVGRMIDVGHRSLDHRLAPSDAPAAPGEQPVGVVTLAEALDMTGAATIDLVKIDVEGAEVDILEAADAGVLGRVKRIALEFHDNLRPGTLARVRELLAGTHDVVATRGDAYGILQARLRPDGRTAS